MASKGDYILSKGFNQNIFHWNDKDTYVNTISKQGKGFFPGNEVLNPKEPDEPPVPPAPTWDPYLTFSSEDSFSMSAPHPNWNGIIQYSTDTENWDDWDGSKIDSGEDNKLYFRGIDNSIIAGFYDDGDGGFEPYNWRFNTNDNVINCEGNIETLLDYQTVINGGHPSMIEYCFSCMFYNGSSLVTAPELPITTLSNYCYQQMFYGSGIIVAPQLPATTLTERCYNRMFENCLNLTTAPTVLPATTLTYGCYQDMFYGCSSLINLPQILAEVLAEWCCYSMFANCTAITTVSKLSATTLASNCYTSMFSNCTSLTTAPELPATTLANYCYNSMFYNCTSLVIPPELPATILANSCYLDMFAKCSSLIILPELPATILANSCYKRMFSGCTSIRLATIQNSSYAIPYRIPTTGTGVTATGALDDILYGISIATSTASSVSMEINTVYYCLSRRKIEDSVDTMVEKINNNTANYEVGDWIDINTSNNNVWSLQIIGKNKDILSEGGTAKYTFACGISIGTWNMNTTTSTEGGFTNSYMKSYLVGVILPKLPQSIQNSIKTVSKITKNCSYYKLSDDTSNETIWLLSKREINGSGDDCENSGPIYDQIFTDNNSRIRTNVGNRSVTWWLRSTNDSNDYCCVIEDGSFDRRQASQKNDVLFGFCL